MKYLIPIILLFVFASQHFAQEYFPLQTDNSWELIGRCDIMGHEADPDTILLSVQKDSLFSNGKTYFVLSDSIGFGKFMRVESDIIYYYDAVNSADVAVYDLKAPLESEDSVAFGNSSIKYSVWLGEIYQDTIFNIPTNIIHYWVDGDASFSICFSDKFGPVQYNNKIDKDPLKLWKYSANKCEIGGVKYGLYLDPITFPLAVNNSWTFYGTGAECFYNENGEGVCLLIEHRDTLTLTVQKDTVMSNSKTYYKAAADFIANQGFKFNENLRNPVFMRADENYLYVYDDSADAEIALLNLTGTLLQDDTVYFGSEPNMGYNIWISGLEETVKFGQDIKTVSYYMFELDTLEFVGSDVYHIGVSDKFGFADFSQTYWFKDENTSNERPYQSYSFRYKLGKCTIDGIEYNDNIGIEPGGKPNMPESFSLAQNYPNPFNPSTTIEFSVPRQSHIKLAVFDVLGREIAVLASGVYSAGNYKANFNGANLTSGVYFYSLETGDFLQTKKFILLK